MLKKATATEESALWLAVLCYQISVFYFIWPKIKYIYEKMFEGLQTRLIFF